MSHFNIILRSTSHTLPKRYLFINTILPAFPPSLCLLTDLTITYSLVWSPKQCFVKGTNHPVTKYLIRNCTLFSHLDDDTDFSFNTVKFTDSFLYHITTVRLLAILIRSCCLSSNICHILQYFMLLCCQRSNPQHNVTVPLLYVGLELFLTEVEGLAHTKFHSCFGL